MAAEIIVKVGFEGGSVTLMGEHGAGGWQFFVNTNESAWADLLDEDNQGIPLQTQSAPTPPNMTGDLHEALALLDRYPWYAGYPLHVHPLFAAGILEAVETRATRHDAPVSQQWHKVCAAP